MNFGYLHQFFLHYTFKVLIETLLILFTDEITDQSFYMNQLYLISTIFYVHLDKTM